MEKKEKKKNWVEWSVLIVSGSIVVFAFGFLIFQLFSNTSTPPDIVVELGIPESKQDYFVVSLTAKNKGSKTAENLRIEVATDNPDAAETAYIEFAYLPGNSTVKGALTFTKKPKPDGLKVHILGYVEP